MPKRKTWTYTKRKRRGKKRGSSNANRNPPVIEDVNVEEDERSASDADEADIEVPSSAIMPARRVGDSPLPLIVHAVKSEPVDMETEEMALDNDMNKTLDLPLNSQKAASENVSSAAAVSSQHEFENKENVNYSSETNSCIPEIKIKKEPVESGYDLAFANKPSDVIDDVEQVRKKIKIELTDCTLSVTGVSNVKASEQNNAVVANQNDNCESNVTQYFTEDSNSRDTVLNMPIDNMDVEQDTVFTSGFNKIKQEHNSIAVISAEAKTDRFAKYGLIYIKKETDENSTPSLNCAEVKEQSKTVINLNDTIDSKVLSEILTNISTKSELVSATSSINTRETESVSATSSINTLKTESVSATSNSNTRETESINSCSETPGEKTSSLDNKPCNHSSISTSSCSSSKSEQLEKSKTVSSTEWPGKNTSPVAASSNSRLNSSNITVGSLKKRLHLYFDLFNILGALKCMSERTINKPDKVLYSSKSKGILMDDNMKLSNPNLPYIEKKINDFISNIKMGKESEKVVPSECKSLVNRIVSPISSQESSLTHTCSDTSVENTSTNNKSIFISTKKIDSSRSKAPTFLGNVGLVSPSKEVSAKTDPISSEKMKQLLSILAEEDLLSANLSPRYTNSSITSHEIPSVAVSAKQSVQISNSNSSDSTYDHSKNLVRQIRNFPMNCTDLNREHNIVPSPFIESKSVDASYVARTETFRKQSMNMERLNNMNYINTDFEQNSIPTLPIGNVSRIPSLVPPVNSSRNQDLPLAPASPRHQVVNIGTEMTRTNNYQHGSKSTSHIAKSPSISSVLDSVGSSNASRKTANVHNVFRSSHVSCNYENNKEGKSLQNVSFSDKNRAQSAVSNIEKRKITSNEYLQRNKIIRVDNGDKRKLNSEYSVVNSAKPRTTAEESLRMESGHDPRDPRLRRNVTCGTAPNIASHFVPMSSASGRAHPSILNSGISNIVPSTVFTSQALYVPSSSKSAPSMESTVLANNASITESKRHPFQSPLCAASRVPISKSSSCNTKLPILMPISQSEKFVHQNKSISIHQSISESSVGDFPRRRGNAVGVEQWHSNIGKKMVTTNDVIHFVLEWNFHWLDVQLETQTYPPICEQYNEVKDSYRSVTEYYNTYFPLHMLNIWRKIYSSWTSQHYQFHKVKYFKCEEKNLIRISCTCSMNGSEINDFLKRDEIVCVKFTRDGKEDKLFGYIFMVGEKPDTIRIGWKKVMVSFYTAEKLNIPLGTDVFIQRLENIRVLLKQHDALRSLEQSPFKEIILKPRELASKIYMVTLPYSISEAMNLIGIIASHTNDRNRITLVDTPSNVDRMSFISALVRDLYNKKSNVLVCLQGRETLIELANKILPLVKTHEFVLALKPTEIKLPDKLVRHTLRERIKIGGKEPNESEVTSLCTQILKDSKVILTVLSSIFCNECKSAFPDSSLKCIIDNASSFTEIETMLPLYYNIGHLVLMGDPLEDIPMQPKKYGYHKSLFTRLFNAKNML